MTAFLMNNINKKEEYADFFERFKDKHTTMTYNNNDKSMLNLLQQGMSIDLASNSYEEMPEEIWTLIDSLTDGIEVDLD